MNDGDKTRDTAIAAEKSPSRWYLMPITILILALLSLIMLAAVDRIGKTERSNFALGNALMDLQIYAATSHLWFEEAITDNSIVGIEKAWSDLDRTVKLSGAILEGGQTEHGQILQPLRDPMLRTQAEEILRLLSKFRTIAQERYQDPRGAGIGSPLDHRFDKVFVTIMDRAKDLELRVEKIRVANQVKSRRFMFGILMVWLSILVTATVMIWNQELRRRKAEMALLESNEQLESRSEELKEHREQLMELVKVRTVELTTANRQLQQEIADRNEAVKALHTSEKQYRMLVDTMNEGLALIDEAGVLAYVNDKYCDMLGYSRGELLGCPETDFVLERDRKIAEGQMERCRRGEQNSSDLIYRRKDGQEVFTIRSSRPIFGEDHRFLGSFAVVMDMTKRITLQKEAMRAAHLASLGELAAGVAHEINNPINGIINYARILRNQIDAESGERDIAGRILKEGRRIADIVRGLLSFARDGEKDKKPVHLGEILSDSIGLTGSQLKKEGIALDIAIPSDFPEIIANPKQIQQVFMNVLINARYALNQKYAGPHENKRLEILGEATSIERSPFVRITFHDHGTGIPANIIDKVKDPFFSTKPSGQGTGLGLSISHGIVSDHGGKLTIESTEGEFTKVAIDLPAMEGGHGEDPRD